MSATWNARSASTPSKSVDLERQARLAAQQEREQERQAHLATQQERDALLAEIRRLRDAGQQPPPQS